jgi:Cdc6-like AAA superfamily ATPase
MYDCICDGDGMLEAFLDGCNSTIMAYGQTGSGKTFTMGSEAGRPSSSSSSSAIPPLVTSSSTIHTDDFNQGLIPRFMTDFFSSLEQRKKSQSNTNNINNNSK